MPICTECSGGGLCRCSVDEGTNVTITGTGALDDPWIINAADCITLYEFNSDHFVWDDPVGDGSCDDPFVINVSLACVLLDDLATFALTGALTAPTLGTLRFRFPFDATLVGVSAAVDTAPTGADMILDVNLNGTSIFIGTPPTIAAGTFDTGSVEIVPDTTAVLVGDYLQVDIDQVGSIVAGSDLTVFIRYTHPITCPGGL